MTDQTFQTSLNKESVSAALKRLGLIRDSSVNVFSTDTRDVKNLMVYRDNISGVIFIDDYYVGSEVYKSGAYRGELKPLTQSTVKGFEDYADTDRRIKEYSQYIVGRSICDFGCGYGSFLKKASSTARSVHGVELQQDCLDQLNRDGITCVSDISKLPHNMETCFLFHVFEHFHEPALMLKKIKAKLKADGEGLIVIEVPHAKDFLISHMELKAFTDFTLWSQHLILHTRESLSAFLYDAGFKSVVIEGVQRYGLSNHLHWLKNQKPGGHKSPLSIFETESLRRSYAEALSKIDANDTLVAVART